MNETDFSGARVGDRVWDIRYGWAQIIEVNPHREYYPLMAISDEGQHSNSYLWDGRAYVSHVYPVLFWDEIPIVAPPRPKRKVKKVLDGWVNVYPDGYNHYYQNKESADICANENRIACVHVVQEYEVEE